VSARRISASFDFFDPTEFGSGIADGIDCANEIGIDGAIDWIHDPDFDFVYAIDHVGNDSLTIVVRDCEKKR